MIKVKCKANKCNNKRVVKGYCRKHYAQIGRNGKISIITRCDPNEYVCKNNSCKIILRNKNNIIVAKTIIDCKNLKKVIKHKWHFSKRIGYASTMYDKKVLLLHHLILPKKPKLVTDHINRDKLNNLESNLRCCTRSQNCMNKITKGYYFDKRNNKWTAEIMLNQKKIYLGSFKYEEDAIKVRRKAEKKYFKEYAPER